MALAELGRWPLHVHWVQQLVRFWNRLVCMAAEQPDRLVCWAFQDNLALLREQLAEEAAGRAVRSPCWSRKWLHYLQNAPTDTGTLVWLTEMDEAAVVGRAKAAYITTAAGGATAASAHAAACMVAATTQRSAGGDGNAAAAAAATAAATTPAATLSYVYSSSGCGNKFAVYLESERGALPLGEMAAHLREGAVSSVRHRAALSRLRCSCHDLRIERDRYLPPSIKPPRHLRTCLMCGSDSIEDEHHMVFDCPLYSTIRFKFADIFSTCLTLDSFLSQNQGKVAEFIYSCSELRSRTTHLGHAGPEKA